MLSLQSVVKAESLNEALTLLEEYSDKAKVIAGGTDLVIALGEGKVSPEAIIDISGLEEIKSINDCGEYIEIGAGVSFTQLWTNQMISKEFSGLAEAAHLVGSPQIRNRGTIGGNIANGSPAADTVPPLLALEAKCILKSAKGDREVDIKDIHKGKGIVDINPNELLYSIKVKKLGNNAGIGFSKIGLRNSLAISRLSVAVCVKMDNGICVDCKIGSGSLSKCPEKEKEIEDLVIGKKIDIELITHVADKFENHIKERLAGRSTMEYKSEAVKGSFIDAINKALDVIN